MEPKARFPPGYVTTILEDAKIYSSHAKKSSVDADDVRLAIQCRTDQSFTSPPPRDVSAAGMGGDTGLAPGHGGGRGLAWGHGDEANTQGCGWNTGVSLGHKERGQDTGMRPEHGDVTGTRGCCWDTGICLDTWM